MTGDFCSFSLRLPLLVVCMLFTACSAQNLISEEERQKQAAADQAVAELLFEQSLTETASYNVHPDGRVVIKFDRSVPGPAYRVIVERLREDVRVAGVRAEQEGKEVCRLRRWP